MTPICFIDGAQFDSVRGFLSALRHGVLDLPDGDEALALLSSLLHRPGRGTVPDRPRLHLVWLNSDVSRRRLNGRPAVATEADRAGWLPTERRLRVSFSDLTRYLAGFPGIELILL